jgi:allophanate hydrolase subunit 1
VQDFVWPSLHSAPQTPAQQWTVGVGGEQSGVQFVQVQSDWQEFEQELVTVTESLTQFPL